MADDTYVYTPPPDPPDSAPPPPPLDPPVDAPRRLGGLGRTRAVILLAGGLILGGGIGGYVIASAATTPSPSASPSPGSGSSTMHPCPHMGGSSSTGGTTATAYFSY
ncbi:MAG: hypothetical protein E6I55_06690 [Chloroflexi bacterium]|nr:MAG: hypothetical protein E6I55_06690 [Chloroflexota bacterium]